MQRTKTIWTIIKEGHIRIIPVKFDQNPSSSLGDVLSFEAIVDDHSSSPWANGSGELKTHLEAQSS